MKKIIAFDMDGTIADLYSVKDWLPKLEAEDPSPYIDAEPLLDMTKLNEICKLLKKAGWEIRVITAMSKNASSEYKDAIYKTKLAWLKKWGFVADRVHGIDYTTKKCDVLKQEMKDGGTAILIDDESRHTSIWDLGAIVNPTKENIIETLYKILQK